MTDDRTPLQLLEDAVHDFITVQIDGRGAPAGWVLAYQMSYVTDNGPDITPLVWDVGYAASPGVSPFTAMGLTDYTRARIRQAYLTAEEDP